MVGEQFPYSLKAARYARQPARVGLATVRIVGLRADKQRMHLAARALSPKEKVARVIELQRIVLPLIARRRPLRRHEVIWD